MNQETKKYTIKTSAGKIVEDFNSVTKARKALIKLIGVHYISYSEKALTKYVRGAK